MIGPGAFLVNRYTIGSVLAHGGMSVVYVAHDQMTGRDVALKVLRSTDPTSAERFDRESRLLAQLRHPRLVEVLDAGEHEGERFLVLGLVDGSTLASRLLDGPLDVGTARRVGADLAEGLAYLHGRGVIHRDLKPSNVLIGSDGRARLCDFGIARWADATTLTATSSVVGTAAYLAPEQIDGTAATSAADVYALGLVLLECLTAQKAFPGEGIAATLARLQVDPSIPELPEPWPRLLRQMLERDPDQRPEASAVLGALAKTSDATIASAPVVGPEATAVSAPVVGSDATTISTPDPTEVIPVTTATVAADRATAESALAPPPATVTGRQALPAVYADVVALVRSRRWSPWAAVAAFAVLILIVSISALAGNGSDAKDVSSVESSTTTTSTTVITTTTTEAPPPPTAPAPRTRGGHGKHKHED